MCSIAIDQAIRLFVSSTINSGVVFESARKVASRGEAANSAKGQPSGSASTTAAAAAAATAATTRQQRHVGSPPDAAAVVGFVRRAAESGAIAA